nr:hypothetical protein Iba_chr14dCG4810 [Ipomoea batatas]
MAGISSSQCMLEEFMETVTIQENRYSTSRTPCQKYLLSILQSLAKQLSRDGLEYPFTSEVEVFNGFFNIPDKRGSIAVSHDHNIPFPEFRRIILGVVI